VALFEEAGETHLVLTRRSFSLREHRGEIALPGGGSDAGETPSDTALREAREEVGINESVVRVVGWLSPIVTLALGSAICPSSDSWTNDRHGDRSGRSRPCVHGAPRELLAEGTFLEERWRT